eukprot:CAMPEP_0175122256 /NCGR_PEP_ID=MMETSP0087-20121206/1621_1 /TAXON_ID=136419 /ORGANISM="Unknown Unknown, Strain D1" /LENGTH=461 /DNA_ID=CAMNT_0016403885 /DNA_START=60 /DNA_END=1442 /DNA_ORIENTATION=-
MAETLPNSSHRKDLITYSLKPSSRRQKNRRSSLLETIWHVNDTPQGESSAQLNQDEIPDHRIVTDPRLIAILDAEYEKQRAKDANEDHGSFESDDGEDESSRPQTKIDRWGMVQEHSAEQNEAERTERAKKSEKDKSRELKWIKMLRSIQEINGGQGQQTLDEKVKAWIAFEKKNREKIKSRIRKGVPDSVRMHYWPLFTGALEAQAKHPNKYSTYQKQLSGGVPTEVEKQIKKDLRRTFPDHVMFKINKGDKAFSGANNGTEDEKQFTSGQRSLYNLLAAVALDHPDLGYTQGMNMLASTFLMYMGEEDSFWMMHSVLNEAKFWSFKELYMTDFPLLSKFFYCHDKLLKKVAPKVSEKLVSLGVLTNMYAWQWFMTGFIDFPRGFVTRIWDIFFYEGVKIYIRVSVGLVLLKEKQILEFPEEEGIAVVSVLKDTSSFGDIDDAMEKCLKVNVSTKQVETW